LISASLLSPPLLPPSTTHTFIPEYAGFPKENVRLLIDDTDTPSEDLPTRKHLFDAMEWLVEDAKGDDSLFFHCECLRFGCLVGVRALSVDWVGWVVDSGHGGQVEDPTGEEEDGYNEGELIMPSLYS
jgi:metacaspase-1